MDVALNDADLVRQIGSGTDRQAEAELVRRMAPRIRLYGLRHTRDEHVAEDLTQQVPRLSLQNRPTEPYPGPDDVVPCRRAIRQVLLDWKASSCEPQGDRARGISAERFEIPLAGGGAWFAAWGEPSPPRLAPGGNGKGG